MTKKKKQKVRPMRKILSMGSASQNREGNYPLYRATLECGHTITIKQGEWDARRMTTCYQCPMQDAE